MFCRYVQGVSIRAIDTADSGGSRARSSRPCAFAKSARAWIHQLLYRHLLRDGCGNCSYGTGGTCNDDADYTGGINHTIDLTTLGGSISNGCFSFNYEITCTSLCCLSAGAVAGVPTCAGDNAIFNVSFNDSDTPITYEVFDQTNGVVIGTGMSSPIAATAVGPTTAGPITIIVRDVADPGGCVTPPITVTLPECPEPQCIIPNGVWSK